MCRTFTTTVMLVNVILMVLVFTQDQVHSTKVIMTQTKQSIHFLICHSDGDIKKSKLCLYRSMAKKKLADARQPSMTKKLQLLAKNIQHCPANIHYLSACLRLDVLAACLEGYSKCLPQGQTRFFILTAYSGSPPKGRSITRTAILAASICHILLSFTTELKTMRVDTCGLVHGELCLSEDDLTPGGTDSHSRPQITL